MAAPYTRLAVRPFCQILSCVGWTGRSRTGVRQISVSQPCLRVQDTNTTESVASASAWRLMGAVCLQRLPVISQDRNPIEEQFAELMHQMEFERSLLSEHELRLLEDAERMSRKQAGDYDSDEEEVYGTQDIVTAQDLEDAWEQKLKQFQLAPRARAGEEKELSCARRCLGDSLVLLTEQTVGSEKLWLLPQLQWRAGEDLRQTAQRALTSLPGPDFEATFLGNAPCGVYKYKLPKAARTESNVGTKVFFFKAILSDGSVLLTPKGPFMWVKESELQDYLKPAYLEKVKRFLLSL